MEEVRVRVRLTNAVHQALVRRGALTSDQVRVYESDALVDTGAVRCVLPPFVVERLGLDRVARYSAQYADGRLTAEEALVLGDEVLVGQTALEKLDLFVDCQRQCVVPNPAHPDQPVSKVK